jgi:hypothetical protein
VDSNQPLTLEQWEHAKKYYPFDNDMQEFFDAVVDPKKFLEYMNKIVPVVRTLPLLNVNKDE